MVIACAFARTKRLSHYVAYWTLPWHLLHRLLSDYIRCTVLLHVLYRLVDLGCLSTSVDLMGHLSLFTILIVTDRVVTAEDRGWPLTFNALR